MPCSTTQICVNPYFHGEFFKFINLTYDRAFQHNASTGDILKGGKFTIEDDGGLKKVKIETPFGTSFTYLTNRAFQGIEQALKINFTDLTGLEFEFSMSDKNHIRIKGGVKRKMGKFLTFSFGAVVELSVDKGLSLINKQLGKDAFYLEHQDEIREKAIQAAGG
jgi:hypothetical protein